MTARGRSSGAQCSFERSLAISSSPDAAGSAALAIIESLLLALDDRKVLPEHEILGILNDAAAAHAGMPETAEAPGHHAAVAALIEKIMDGGNSGRGL